MTPGDSRLPAVAAAAVADLARAVLSVQPMIEGLAGPVRVSAGEGVRDGDLAGPAAVLRAVARGTGSGDLRACPGRPDSSLAERVVSDRLALGGRTAALAGVTAPMLGEVAALARRVAHDGFERHRARPGVRAPDGVPLRAYAAGPRSGRAVVIATACGMPAPLCERWLDALSADHLVMTWQNRGFDGTCEEFDLMAVDAGAQAADLVAVLDHYGVADAHVMGFCTGSVIALAAAAAYPDRVRSLSLWHGAYELGADELKTSHQRHMQALMAMAAGSRKTAASAHAIVAQATLRSTPPDLAHLVLAPFATREGLYRYCKVNGTVTGTGVTALLPRVTQPVLVVTSADDDTAHPAASRAVAAGLPAATLRIEPHGNHLSLFKADPRLQELARDFIDAVIPA